MSLLMKFAVNVDESHTYSIVHLTITLTRDAWIRDKQSCGRRYDILMEADEG